LNQALEKFNRELEKLSLNQEQVFPYNIFSIIGFGGQEIKHSNFLKWMFDHKSEHGLGNTFLKNFLYQTIQINRGENQEIDSDILDQYESIAAIKKNFTTYEVRREWKHLDLFILDEENKLLVFFENKVFSDEIIEGDRSQLDNYLETIESYYPDFQKICIFLTPYKTLPHFKRHRDIFLKANFHTIYGLLNKLQSSIEKQDLLLLVTSYMDLLKRKHMITDKNTKKAVDKMWQNEKYQYILKAIVNQQPSIHAELLRAAKLHIQENYTDLVLDDCNASGTRFITVDLETTGGEHIQYGNNPMKKSGLYFYIGKDNRKKGNDIYISSILSSTMVNQELKSSLYKKFNNKEISKSELKGFPYIGEEIVLIGNEYFEKYEEAEEKESIYEEMKEEILKNLDRVLQNNESEIYKIEKEFLGIKNL